MQFAVEEALLVKADLEVAERAAVEQRRDLVAAAEQRARQRLDTLQGRMH